MAIEQKFTELPTVANSTTSDIICAVQGYVSPSNLGLSTQQTLGQVMALFQTTIILSNAGNPNTVVAGTLHQMCWDTVNNLLWICTTPGAASTAVWTKVIQLTAGTNITITQNGDQIIIDSTAGSVAPGLANEIAFYPSNGSVIDGITGQVSALLVTNATGVPAMTPSLVDGQIVIGATSGTPAPATLTAGPGISIGNGPNSITISGTGSGIGWTEVTGTSQAMTADNGYITNNAGLVTLTLPATAAIGTAISVVGKGVGGWRIAQNSGQHIEVGIAPTTGGVAGSVSSTSSNDSINLICTTANTVWTTLGAPQSLGLTIV
jgi:hypothetical protein